MRKITLDEFCNHWVLGSSHMVIVSMFEKNVTDFTTMAGEYSKSFFIRSFNSGGFYGTGAKWAPRESRWGKKFIHPTLIDTGKLHSKISGTGKETHIGSRKNNRSKLFKRGARYDISTNEFTSAQKGKRGKSNNKYQNYAAIHNTDPKFHSYTVNQYSQRKPVQRQFIGLNKRLDFDITRFYDLIFRGFPNA